MTSHQAIEARELSKTFRRRSERPVDTPRWHRRQRVETDAVRGITMSVSAGEMVGYIGPNGAGKSTTIKMLTGILQPTSGFLRVAGLTPIDQRKQLARRLGVVFGQRSNLWWDLPLAESFELLRHVYRVEPHRHARNLAWFTELFELGPFLATPVRQLSLGQRMRGELTGALLHDPEVLFLDEPTIGLDVVSKRAVRVALAELNRERGVTVVLTTHDLADVEQVCQRLVIIDHGRIIFDDSLDQLMARHGTERTLVVDLEPRRLAVDTELLVPGLRQVRSEGDRRWLRFERSHLTAAQAIAAVAETAPLHDLTIEEPAIEDIVHHIYTSAPAS
jgi:ABC-2 type transport system ATP-binding protein